MALRVMKIRRKFVFKEDGKTTVTLVDPGNHLSPEEVQKVYSGQHPALTNAIVDGPKISKGEAVYTFTTKAGKLG